jgi:predicted nucleic acid-binding protein
MLIDTDVLIWMTRGHARAAARLQMITPWRISAVKCMEGARLNLALHPSAVGMHAPR